MSTAKKKNPALWERAKREAVAKMGGKHSARAMQLATQIYKKKGGKYEGAKKSTSLSRWTKQDWEWSGGKKGKGVYLPARKIAALKASAAGKKKLAKAGKKKAAATRSGKQYSRHGLAAGTSKA